MKSIAFLVDEEFHREFKVICAMNGRQMKERIMELMQKDIEENKKENSSASNN